MAVAIAWICAEVSPENDPMPPLFAAMAAWIVEADAPRLLLVASAPWQPEQFWV